MGLRDALLLAGRLTEYSGELIPIAPQAIGAAARACARRWGDRLRHNSAADSLEVFYEISAADLLLRVSSTLIYAAGQRSCDPSLSHIAEQLVQRHSVVVSSAGLHLCRTVEPCGVELGACWLETSQCLADISCGALLAQTGILRYAPNEQRARDFAITYGRMPGLARIPYRRAARELPATSREGRAIAWLQEGVRNCFPGVQPVCEPNRDELVDLVAMLRIGNQ